MNRQAAEGQGFDDVRQMPGGAIKLLDGLRANLLIGHARQGKGAYRGGDRDVGPGDRENGPFPTRATSPEGEATRESRLSAA